MSSPNLIKSLTGKFATLPPKQRRTVYWLLGLAGILALGFVGQSMRSNAPVKARAKTTTGEFKPIDIEPDMLKKTQLLEQRQYNQKLQEQLEALDKKIEAKQGGVTAASPVATPPAEQVSAGPGGVPTMAAADQRLGMSGAGPGPASAPHNQSPGPGKYPQPYQDGGPSEQARQEPQKIGDIGVLTNSNAAKPETKEGGDKKKENRKIFLPPSFMAAEQLTGFDAATSGEGSSNPEPVLLRIQTPAVLPNEIKANVQGCFMIGEARGKLNKERADVRIVSLTCLVSGGQSLIDAKVKGFVVDSDGKVGLSGRVVSKVGASMARAVLAGIFGGAGDALKASTMTQSVSALGNTNSIDPSQIGKSAAGSGISEGADTLRKFYLDLAKQSTPVIEIGPTKKVTVVISEGIELEIKDFSKETTDAS